MSLSLWDRFLIAVTPESPAEKAANDAIRGNVAVEDEQTDPNDYVLNAEISGRVQAGSVGYAEALDRMDPRDLSAYEKFIIAITPQSEGERIADYNMRT